MPESRRATRRPPFFILRATRWRATRAAEFNVPILILHGTADGSADGGGVNTRVALARDFEATLRRNQKPVEAHYTDGGGHNTLFTNPTQYDDELKG